jgi:signal recognition particle GTPase
MSVGGECVVLGLGRKKLAQSLTKTRRGFFGQVMQLFGANEVTEETWEDLEALLIQADVGVETTVSLVERLRERVNQEHIVRSCWHCCPRMSREATSRPGSSQWS